MNAVRCNTANHFRPINVGYGNLRLGLYFSRVDKGLIQMLLKAHAVMYNRTFVVTQVSRDI